MTPCSILVADDEPDLRRLIQMFLEREGHHVVVSANGNEARVALTREAFEVVLTDLIMPGTDGLALIADVQKKYPKVRIVAMSGGGFVPANQYLTVAKNSRVHATLAKPFTRATLADAIAKARR